MQPPYPHSSGIRPPGIPRELVPQHVAIVMDGDGRWAKERGLPRTEGHKRGEAALMDVLMGGIELGVKYISAYAFSTENWRRHPDEVACLRSFTRDVIHRRREELAAAGVRIRWAGRRPRLWRSVIRELENAEQLSEENTVLTLQFCCNYGGRAERRTASLCAPPARPVKRRSGAPAPKTSPPLRPIARLRHDQATCLLARVRHDEPRGGQAGQSGRRTRIPRAPGRRTSRPNSYPGTSPW